MPSGARLSAGQPSLASLHTGLEPSHHGAIRVEEGFGHKRSGVKMLASRLAERGYDTAASCENPFAGPLFGFEEGFARFRHDSGSTWALPRPICRWASTRHSAGVRTSW